jgi:signal transduction protein with GAF and PtsI domain
LTKSWTSGGKSTEAIEKLRLRLSQLESKRDELVEKNKHKVFDWGSYALNSATAPKNLEELRNSIASQEVKEIVAIYELLNQEIMDKEASLNEKLDEQARYDSLG